MLNATASQRVVLHVIAPGPVGGAESVVAALATARRSLGGPTHVVTLGEAESSAMVSRLLTEGVPVHPVQCGRRAYGCEIRGIMRVARAVGANVIHTHVYRANFAGYFAARRLRLPVIATYHGACGGDWRNHLYEWLDRRLLSRFDAVACVSKAGRDWLRGAAVPARRLHVVENAHRPPPVLDRATARSRLGLANDPFAIGWIGRLSREKGADLLIEALAAPGLHGVAAVLIGDGPERLALERRARALGLIPDAVRFVGQLADAGSLFLAFDAVAITSRREGLPMVLLEAMSAGVPVVSFAVGGIPEVLSRDMAWLVPPGQPTALAHAVREVVDHPDEAAERAARARSRFYDHFGGPHAESRWVSAVEQLYGAFEK